MKKRFNLTWRIMVALVLVLSLVPALIATTGGVALAAGPSVWLDPIPAYVNDGMMPLIFSGTSLATAPRTVAQVLIQIKFQDTVTGTWLYWDGTPAVNDWVPVADSYNTANFLSAPGATWGTQVDWRWNAPPPDAPPLAAAMTNGITYTVTAWAVDDNVEKGSPVTRTFVYDKTLPTSSAVVIIGDAAAPGWVATSITSISGVTQDTAPGAVGQVWLTITDTTAGRVWDGTTWVAPPAEILATGTTSWSVTALPNWTHGHFYTAGVRVLDKAGNQEAVPPVPQAFTYNKAPATGLNNFMDVIPAYMQGANFVSVTGVVRASGINTISDGWVKIYNNAGRYWDEAGAGGWVVGDPDIWNVVYPQILPAVAPPSQKTPFGDFVYEDWRYTIPPAPNWPATLDGYTYTVWSKMRESSGTPASSTPQSFVIDNTRPAGTTITSMGITTWHGTTVFQGASYETLVQGTAADATGGIASGRLDSVLLRIVDVTVPGSWNGLTWGAGPVDLRATAKDGSFNSNAEGWQMTSSTTPALPSWRHNHQYTITAYSVDDAGNIEAIPAVPQVTFWYVKDLSGTAPIPTPTPTIAPTPTAAPALTCAVTYPTNNGSIAMPGPVSINGTSGDDVAVTGLKVRVFNVSSGLYWNGSAWVASLALGSAPAATAADGAFNSFSEPWFYTTLPTWGNGSSYQVQAQASDGTNTADSAVVLFGIGVTPTPPATPTPTPTPTAAPTPTPTPTAAPTPTPTPSTSGSGTVGTSGGTVATGDGKIEITFPAGAFDASTTVTITGGTCSHGDVDEFVVGSTCFSVTPSGALGAEATICVDLSSYDLSLGDEGDLTLGYWADGTWNEASDITITGSTICGKTSDLSDWAVLSSTGEGWVWWYWALIGGGAFIVVLAIILLIALPKKGKGEEIPAEELYGEEEEEF